jgi:hypothetical protein
LSVKHIGQTIKVVIDICKLRLKDVAHLLPKGYITNHSKDWQIWRGEIKTGNEHAHFDSEKAMCQFIIIIFQDKEQPISQHFQESAHRLLNDQEYAKLKLKRKKTLIKQMRRKMKVYRYR